MRQMNIPLADLFVSPLNVRKALGAGQEDSGIDELATSIGTKGLIAPLTVRPTADGRYEILVGQRRFLACQKTGLNPVPCVVRDKLNDADAMTLSLVENVHRADMDPMDKARALKGLYERYGSYDRVAKESGWSVTTIRKYIQLLALPTELQEMVTTTNGAAGVGTLSRLASTFAGDKAVEAYAKIAGFNGRIQEEILKQSEGDITILEDLVDEAREGAFDVRRCGGKHGCEIVRDIVEYRVTQDQFQELVQTSAGKHEPNDPEFTRLKGAAWAFWKALAAGNR